MFNVIVLAVYVCLGFTQARSRRSRWSTTTLA